MATLTFTEVKLAVQIFMSEWAVISVYDEVLMPASADGKKWISKWDNWIIDPAVGGLEPLIMLNGIALEKDTDYTITASGDGVRGKIELANAPSMTPPTNALVLASFRRALLRDLFWGNCIQRAADEIATRLLYKPPHFDIDVEHDATSLDATKDPWSIIVKQAGHDALINLQMLLDGLGKTRMEGMQIDFSHVGSTIIDSIQSLEKEIANNLVAWRWANSPLAQPAIRTYGRCSGPFYRVGWG